MRRKTDDKDLVSGARQENGASRRRDGEGSGEAEVGVWVSWGF